MTQDHEENRQFLQAVSQLCENDPDIAAVIERLGPPPPRREPPGFKSLVKILIGQQVSLASASAIWQRLNSILEVAPEVIADASDETLRAAGLSRPKIRYARALAENVAGGRLDLQAIESEDEETVRAALTAVPGIGRWTSDIYLLFCLRRLDTWPGGDLAIQEALRSLKSLAERPKEQDTLAIAEAWRPHRGVAAQVLWRHYRFLKFGPDFVAGDVFPVTEDTSS